MAHVRTQLRHAVVALVTGLPTTGANVVTDHPEPFDPGAGELPSLYVKVDDVADPSAALDRDFQGREMQIAIEARGRATTGLADLMDAIAVEVESALPPTITVSGKQVDLTYLGTEFDESAEGDKPTKLMSIRYSAAVYINPADPQTIVVD